VRDLPESPCRFLLGIIISDDSIRCCKGLQSYGSYASE
jgi:hypothetical protein